MNKIFKFLGFGFLALSLVVGVGAHSTAADTIIAGTAIAGVTAPLTTITATYPLVTTATATAEYTAAVVWSPTLAQNGSDYIVADATVYTATITLTPKSGYTLTGVTANQFTVAGATATNAANSGVITAVFPITHAPKLTAVIHNENTDTKSITLVFNEPVHLEAENGNAVVTAGNIKTSLNIFISSGGNYTLSTLAAGVAITNATFDTGTNTGTILTITYTGTLVAGTHYVVDTWTVAGGWDWHDAAGNTQVTGVDPIFIASAVDGQGKVISTAPLLTAVAHDETAKTITLTYDQAVHYETEHGNIVTAVSPAILNIFPATWNAGTTSWDYGPSGPSTPTAIAATVAPGATITGASFDGTNTILTVTYSGTLRQTAYTHYVVDSWVAESAPGLDNGGYDLKNTAGGALADAGTAISAFTVTGNDSVHPTLKTVIHNENTDTKTITLVYDKPVELTTEHGDLLVASGSIKDALGIFVSSTSPTATNKSGTYSLGTLAGGVTITGAAFNGGGNSGTILTVTYTGTLTGGLYYVVDSWNGSGGWDIKDVAGNTYDAVTTGSGVSQVFIASAVDGQGKVIGTGPALTAVAHDETVNTITLTYNKPIHFETEHGNVVTAISPSILNIFTAEKGGVIGDYGLDTIASGATIISAVFDNDPTLNFGTVLKITYSGNLMKIADTHYVVDSWTAAGGWDVKDVSGNTDVTGVDPVFIISHSSGGGSGSGGSGGSGGGGGYTPSVTPPVSGDHPEGCSGGNLFNTATGKACINNAEPQGCSGGNLFNTLTGNACVNNTGNNGNSNPGLSGHGPYNFGTVTLKNGSKGAAVMELQRFLNAKLNLGLVVDGKLGPKTIAVIKKWQLDNGLVADGLIGAKTKAKMNAEN